jgi:hypothetical protein
MPERSPISELAFAALREFLDADGWHPQYVEEGDFFRMSFRGRNGEYRVVARVRGDFDQLMIYAFAPVAAPEPSRGAVAEFVTRANYGMRIGNFELDYNDGEVRYKSSLDFEGVGLTPIMIRNAIYPAAQTVDRYFPGLIAVIAGAKSPQAAVEMIEHEPPPQHSQN